MFSNINIEVNLSIVNSGGEERLAEVIEAIDLALKQKYKGANVVVRKGFFKTVDGIFVNDLYIEGEVRNLVKIVRERVLNS